MKWPTHAIGDLFDVARGGSPRPIQKFLTEDPDGINWIMIGDTSDRSKYISQTKKRIIADGVKKSRRVYEGDFLLTNSMSFGRPYILKVSGCIHDGWLVLSPKTKEISPDFFYYLLGSEAFRGEFAKRASGAVVKNLNSSIVKSVKVPLPPLEEQKRIAKILDAANSLRAKRRESLTQLDALLQSTFLEFFGDPVSNPRFWKVAKMKDVCRKITDGTHHSPPIVEKGVPYITAKHIKFDGVKFFDNPWYVSPEDHAKIYARCDPVAGDVLYIKDGATTGIAAINDYDFEFSMLSSVALIRPDQGVVMPAYLCAYLNNDRSKQRFLGDMGGAAIKRLTLSKIKKFDIPVPDIELQEKFSRIAHRTKEQKQLLKLQLDGLDKLFASLQQRAFSGEL